MKNEGAVLVVRPSAAPAGIAARYRRFGMGIISTMQGHRTLEYADLFRASFSIVGSAVECLGHSLLGHCHAGPRLYSNISR